MQTGISPVVRDLGSSGKGFCNGNLKVCSMYSRSAYIFSRFNMGLSLFEGWWKWKKELTWLGLGGSKNVCGSLVQFPIRARTQVACLIPIGAHGQPMFLPVPLANQRHVNIVG